MFARYSVIFLVCLAVVNCLDLCADNDEKCIETRMKNMVDAADKESSLPLFGGLSVEKVKGVEPLAQHDESLVDRVQRYMQTHELNFEVPEEEDNTGRSLNEESRSSKLKKIILPLLFGLKLKMAVILPIVLSAIALVSLKGLGAGLLALLFTGATAFKDLLAAKNAGGGHVTYVTAPEPHVAPEWSRSGAELAYSGYQTIPQ